MENGKGSTDGESGRRRLHAAPSVRREDGRRRGASTSVGSARLLIRRVCNFNPIIPFIIHLATLDIYIYISISMYIWQRWISICISISMYIWQRWISICISISMYIWQRWISICISISMYIWQRWIGMHQHVYVDMATLDRQL